MGKKKKDVEIKPAPVAGDNQEFVAAADKLKHIDEPQIKTRHRRTKAEIEGEKAILSDSGWELFRDVFKMGSDGDAARYGVPIQPKEFFEPLAKQWCIVVNHFLPKGKPIYFACVSAGIGSFCMLKNRNEIIDKKLYPNGKPREQGKKDNLNPGKEGNGEKFPGEIKTQNV